MSERNRVVFRQLEFLGLRLLETTLESSFEEMQAVAQKVLVENPCLALRADDDFNSVGIFEEPWRESVCFLVSYHGMNILMEFSLAAVCSRIGSLNGNGGIDFGGCHDCHVWGAGIGTLDVDRRLCLLVGYEFE